MRAPGRSSGPRTGRRANVGVLDPGAERFEGAHFLATQADATNLPRPLIVEAAALRAGVLRRQYDNVFDMTAPPSGS